MDQTENIIKKIFKTPHVLDLLGQLEFEIQKNPTASDYFMIQNFVPPLVIAKDASGGEFGLVSKGSEEILVYATSEGAAGVPAPNLKSYLSLLVAAPNWRDLCKFSAGGQIAEMKKAWKFIADENETSEAKRTAVRQALGLDLISDPAQSIHQNILHFQKQIRIFSIDGQSEFESLFGPFKIEDNPFYRNK